jgi:hypothetical protein
MALRDSESITLQELTPTELESDYWFDVGKVMYETGLSLFSVRRSEFLLFTLSLYTLGWRLCYSWNPTQENWKLAQILGMSEFRASATPMRRFSKALQG